MAPPKATNLTRKFSRRSLKKANGPSDGAKVHSREEELSRATNKRFNSDSWRKVSRSYQAFPAASLVAPGQANTQILCALSSLTEDQAFQTGSSDIPIRPASSFAAGSVYSSARESPSFLRSRTPSPSLSHRFHHQQQNHSPPYSSTADALAPQVTYATGAPEMSQGPKPNALGYPRKMETIHREKDPLETSEVKKPRKVAGHVPRFNRKLRQNRLSKSPLQGRLNNPSKPKPMMVSEKIKSKRKNSYSSHLILNPFFQVINVLHYLLLLPYTFSRFLSKQPWSVKGKTVLITGGSSGIGAEIARQYAAEGASLALISRTQEALENVAQDCRGLGSEKALFYAADLSNPVSTKLAMKQAIKDFGTFDIVVLNAGRSQGCLFEEIKDPSQIENMIKLNVNGAITSLHYILPQIPKNRDSRIVVISNTAGIVATPYQSIYSATKHALTGFANALRIELQNTYGKDSPRICLVSFPEVSGTNSNNGRMDMGATLPPTKWYSWAGIPLAQAVRNLLPAIAKGTREFGQTNHLNRWRALYAYCPEWVDLWMMQRIQRTHYRPLDEKKHVGHQHDSAAESKTPHNRSWTC